MRKNILIPTDFSKNAWNALAYALTLFKDEKCTFYLLNVYHIYHLTTDTLLEFKSGEKEFENARNKSRKGLEEMMQKISAGSENPLHRFETLSTYNTVLDAIKDTVQKQDIELIIMGTKGENSPANKIYGSTAVDIMEQVRTCPALIIPQNASYSNGSRKEIVFATNYRTFYKRRELRDLVSISKLYNAAIRVLHVQSNEKLSADQEFNKGMLQDILEDVEHSFHTLTNIKVAEGIHSFIESRDSEMLALINKKHNFFYSLFLQPLVKEIGYDAQVPVLVMQLNKK